MLIEDDKNSAKIGKYIYNKLDKLGYKLTDLPDDEKDDDEKVYLFTNKKGDRFTEAHILIVDEDGGAIFLSIYGDITVTDEKV